MSLLTWTKDSPRRPPDWRWNRAVRFAANEDEKPKRSREGTDSFKWISTAKEFLLTWRAATDEADHMRVYEAYPALYDMHEFYRAENPASRHHLEALLLAHDSELAQIATILGLTTEQVETYEAVFFNVQDRKSAEMYVYDYVIKMMDETNSDHYFNDKVLKLFAYRCGWRVAIQLITGVGRLPSSANLDQTRNAMADGIMDIVRSKTLALMGRKLHAPLYEGDCKLLEIFKAFEEYRKEYGAGAGAQDQISLAVRSMFEATHLYVGTKAVNSKALTVEFDNTAVELRHTEQLNLSYGQPSPDLDDLSKLTMDGIVEANNDGK